MFRLLTGALCLFALTVLLPTTPVRAHGDDDHDRADAPAVSAATSPPRLAAEGDGLELVAALGDRKLRIYLDRWADNAPVQGARITVKADGIPAGIAAAEGPGLYVLPAPWADDPGRKQLVFAIEAGGAHTQLAGTLEVAAASDAGAQAPPGWDALLRSPRVWLLGGLAALLGFVIALAFRPLRLGGDMPSGEADLGARSKSIVAAVTGILLLAAAAPAPADAHEGHEHAEEPAAISAAIDTPRRLPNGDVFLPKSSQRLLDVRTEAVKPQSSRQARELIGTVVPDPSTFGQVQAPMDGRIELADRGISHVGQKVAAGEVLAYLSPNIPIADLGTMQQLRAEVAGKLKIAEQRLARLERISSVVAQREIDDTRTELEALREQQRVLAEKDVERIPLTAPVDGVISVANVRAGQVVTVRDRLFEIVDPHRLWIEAIGVAAHAAPQIAAAHAVDPDGHSIPLAFIGRAPSLRQQSQPLQFQVAETHEGLVIGSAVKVYVQEGDPVTGIVLPAAAVVKGANGLARVWGKVDAETFRPLPVRVVPFNGTQALVLSGVEPGTRVVVEGAELIDQVR